MYITPEQEAAIAIANGWNRAYLRPEAQAAYDRLLGERGLPAQDLPRLPKLFSASGGPSGP